MESFQGLCTPIIGEGSGRYFTGSVCIDISEMTVSDVFWCFLFSSIPQPQSNCISIQLSVADWTSSTSSKWDKRRMPGKYENIARMWPKMYGYSTFILSNYIIVLKGKETASHTLYFVAIREIKYCDYRKLLRICIQDMQQNLTHLYGIKFQTLLILRFLSLQSFFWKEI